MANPHYRGDQLPGSWSISTGGMMPDPPVGPQDSLMAGIGMLRYGLDPGQIDVALAEADSTGKAHLIGNAWLIRAGPDSYEFRHVANNSDMSGATSSPAAGRAEAGTRPLHGVADSEGAGPGDPSRRGPATTRSAPHVLREGSHSSLGDSTAEENTADSLTPQRQKQTRGSKRPGV